MIGPGDQKLAERIRLPDACAAIEADDLEVFAVNLDAPADMRGEFWALLSPAERRNAEKFVYPEHQQRYVVGRGMLRKMLAQRLSIPADEVEFVENEYGKLRLADVHRSPNLNFNVSHSGSLALYAFCRSCDVGVDIELVREIEDADDLAERFFSPSEAAALAALQPDRKSKAFLACWTRKEAFIKAIGLGLSCPLNAFDVSLEVDAPARILRIDPSIDSVSNWTLRGFRPHPDYIAAVAYRPRGAIGQDRLAVSIAD